MQGNGTGGYTAPYEYIVKGEKSAKTVAFRVILIAFYVLWTLGNVVVVLLRGDLLALILIVLPLTLWLLIRLTWRRTFVEYEYSIFGDVMTVSRIYGGKSRRVLVEIPLRQVSMIVPYDDDHITPIQAFGAKKRIFAISGFSAPELYAVLWKEDDEAHLLCMEPSNRALELMKRYNPTAFCK